MNSCNRELINFFALCFLLSVATVALINYIPSKPQFLKSQETCDTIFTGGYYTFPELGQGKLWNTRDCDLIFRESVWESAYCMETRSRQRKKETHIVLLGDSRLRQLRDGLIYQLSGIEHDIYVNRSITDDSQLYKAHQSTVTVIKNASTRVEYFWLTEMDDGNGTLGKFLNLVASFHVAPDLILVGGGLWMIRTCTAETRNQTDCALEFRRHFELQLVTLNQLAKKTKVVWVPQNMVVEAKLMAVHPVHREMSNRQLMVYNSIVRDALRKHTNNKVVYWDSFIETDLQVDDTPDGLHLGPRTRFLDVQILLNLLCNGFEMKMPRISQISSHENGCCCCQ